MEKHQPNPDHELKTATTSVELSDQALERAHELNTANFEQRIEQLAGTDVELASDLRLTVNVAEAIKAAAGQALVVGGFARDEIYAEMTGQPVKSKDIDVEVFGIEHATLKGILESFGVVNIVGDQFVITKLVNSENGHDLDFSIPRTDRKTGAGHKDFAITGDPNMSIKEAARRRDFTMNSVAVNPLTGERHDNYGGIEDLKNGILRATDAELFPDDPLRVLRAMQFAGRFNLTVEPETADLCRSIDLSSLPRERIGEEWDKLMLKSDKPSVGLEAARELGILEKLHPDIAVLDQIEQEPDWHPEGNVWNHSKNAANAAARKIREEGLGGDEAMVVMYGSFLHDLGKATTTKPKPVNGIVRLTAHGHELAGVEPAQRFLDQIHMPLEITTKILPVIQEHLYHLSAINKETGELPSNSALRRFAGRLAPASIRLYDLVSQCDTNGRGLPWETNTPSHQIYLRAIELNVSEKPLARAMEGRDFETYGVLKGTIAMGRTVDLMYQLQLDGLFSTLDEGIAYYRDHQPEIEAQVQQQITEYIAGQKAVALQRKEAEKAKHADAKTQKQDNHRERTSQLDREYIRAKNEDDERERQNQQGLAVEGEGRRDN